MSSSAWTHAPRALAITARATSTPAARTAARSRLTAANEPATAYGLTHSPRGSRVGHAKTLRRDERPGQGCRHPGFVGCWRPDPLGLPDERALAQLSCHRGDDAGREARCDDSRSNDRTRRALPICVGAEGSDFRGDCRAHSRWAQRAGERGRARAPPQPASEAARDSAPLWAGAGGERKGGTGGGAALRSMANGSPQPTGVIPSRCSRSSRQLPGCRSSGPSATSGCWSRRSPSSAARPIRWRPTWQMPLARDWRCSSAAMRICPTSVGLPRPTGGWCSASTTSTRRCRGRSSGT